MIAWRSESREERPMDDTGKTDTRRLDVSPAGPNGTRIVAAICTRNRGASLIPAVETVLANDHQAFRLIVIDQSTDDGTARAIIGMGEDPRIHYVRMRATGVSRARNLALAEAGRLGAEFVAFTDDDCTVTPDWLKRMEQVLCEHTRVAIAFCNVDAAPYDPAEGFIPYYWRDGERLIRTLREKARARGMGAGMAVRRRAVESFGGFDEQLGPGGQFPSAEDFDLTIRALLAGWHVFETDQVHVVHYGFRSYIEGRELMRRDWTGIGAAYAKPLRAGRLAFVPLALQDLFELALKPPIDDLLRFKRPRGLVRLVSFGRGFVGGWRTPLELESLCYMPAAAELPAPSVVAAISAETQIKTPH
jgi:glycosyltransferase involved in cell wall biosynthesis